MARKRQTSLKDKVVLFAYFFLILHLLSQMFPTVMSDSIVFVLSNIRKTIELEDSENYNILVDSTLQEIKYYEGFVPYVYDDRKGKDPVNNRISDPKKISWYCTVGYGIRIKTLEDSLQQTYVLNGISKQHAEVLLKEKYISAIKKAKKLIGEIYWSNMTPSQKLALGQLVFNVRTTSFKHSELATEIKKNVAGFNNNDKLYAVWTAWSKVKKTKCVDNECHTYYTTNSRLLERREKEVKRFLN